MLPVRERGGGRDSTWRETYDETCVNCVPTLLRLARVYIEIVLVRPQNKNFSARIDVKQTKQNKNKTNTRRFVLFYYPMREKWRNTREW